MVLDRDIRELLTHGPRRAPATTVERALAAAAGTDQRRPRFARLDRRAWPPVARSASDPGAQRLARLAVVALVIVLVGATVAVGARLAVAPPAVTLTPAGAMNDAVVAPSAKLWPDGRVLIQGQDGARHLFDPLTGASEDLTFGEGWGSATVNVLADGRVLLTRRPEVADSSDATIDVAFYDPVTGDVHLAGSFATPWFGESTLVLRDGRILISGGMVLPRDQQPCSPTACEGGTTATATPSGMSEGVKDAVRLFDPATGQIADVGHLAVARGLHQALELRDGRILVLGGGDYGLQGKSGGEVTDVELLDPATGTSKLVGTLQPARYPGLPHGVLLADGRVLISGGGIPAYPCGIPSPPAPSQPVEQVQEVDSQITYLFDPGTEHVVRGPVLPHFYGLDNVVPLQDGRALAFGMFFVVPADCSRATEADADPWLAVIDPSRSTVYQSLDRMTGLRSLDVDVARSYGAGVQLRDGRVALVADAENLRAGNPIDLVTVGP
jgi:hypothetical protein